MHFAKQNNSTPAIQEKLPTFKPYRPQAFFCRMEEKVHTRYNIWVKLRTGSDESYLKMIRDGYAR